MASHLQTLRREIALAARQANRTVDCITLLAVSKGHGDAAIGAAAGLGLTQFGESYVQEALPKIERLRALALTWHFIGRLQANKTSSVAASFDWVHGIDRPKIAERLSAQRPHYAAPLQVCIQVNIAAEAGKAGVAPGEALALALAVRALPRLRLRGLMCMLPPDLDAADNRRSFAAMRHLLQELMDHGLALDTLSMGMSGDFREAILEGATLVRIGTALFGPRPDARLG